MKIRPYITFDGECNEAIELYKRAFKTDALRIMRFSDLPPNPAFQVPKEYESRVVQATLKFGDNFIRLSDRGPQQPLNAAESERVTIVAEMSSEQVKHAFGVLAEQGRVTMPLEKTFYSPLAGDVVDKFGVMWRLVAEDVTKITGAEFDFVVPDSIKALELYESIFEVQRVEVTGYETGKNEAVFTIYGTRFHMLDENTAFMLIAPKENDPKPMWVNIIVPDIKATYAKAIAAGCKVIQPVTEMEAFGISNAMFTDPFGYIWMLHQIYREVSFEERCRIMEEQMRKMEEVKVEALEQKAELSLAYREHTTMATMTEVMDRGLNAVYNHLKEIGKQPTGAPYAAYLNCNENFTEFDLELGFPVAEEMPVKDSLYMSKTYEGKVVTATYKGSYKTLETAYNATMKYAADNKLELVGIFYDYYLNDPSFTPEDELLTKVVIPVK